MDENKSEVTDKELEDELEKVKKSLLELDLEDEIKTIEIPVELASMTKDILTGYLKFAEDTFTGSYFGLNKEVSEDKQVFVDSIKTCVDAFNELLSK